METTENKRETNNYSNNQPIKNYGIMKKIFETLKNGLISWMTSETGAGVFAVGLLMLLSAVLGWIAGHFSGGIIQIFDQAAYGLHSGLATAAIVGAAGVGRHFSAGSLTTAGVETEAPGLLRNEIDSRIVKIRPMSTPLDQISRIGGARNAGSMKVEYYSVDTRPTTAKLTKAVAAQDGRNGQQKFTINTDADDIFQPSTTVLVNTGGKQYVLYVISLENDGVSVMTANEDGELPALAIGTELVRMGRAAAELDVCTPQCAVVPTKADNLCQIFKAQVEQSTLVKIANKEVGWTFSDQEEAAIIDMRLGMEKNFLFGHKSRLNDPVKGEEVLLTDGIWNQTDHAWSYSKTAEWSEKTLISLCREAFASNAGSSKKVLMAGSDLIEKLHLTGASRVLINDAVHTKWGLDFSEIHTKFGTLYVVLSEIFDQCGMADCGMVIDPEYVTKYSHIPFRTESLNLRQSGLRNVDAIVITEASCLVLRYPNSHMKITAKA